MSIAQGTGASWGWWSNQKGLLKAHEFKYKFYALHCQTFWLHLPLHFQFNLGASSLQSYVMEIRPTTLPLPSEAFNKSIATPHTKSFSEWVSSLSGTSLCLEDPTSNSFFPLPHWQVPTPAKATLMGEVFVMRDPVRAIRRGSYMWRYSNQRSVSFKSYDIWPPRLKHDELC